MTLCVECHAGDDDEVDVLVLGVVVALWFGYAIGSEVHVLRSLIGFQKELVASYDGE